MSTATDPIDELLKRSAPQIDVAELSDPSAAVAARVASQPRKRAGTTRTRRVAIGVAAAAAIGVPTVAAAASFGFHTGWFGDPTHNSEDAGTSEYLNTCDPGFASVISTAQPSVSSPLPAGKTWSMATAYLQAEYAHGRQSGSCGLMQEVGVKRQYNKWGQCSWLRDAAAASGDATHLAMAGRALRFYGDEPVNHETDGGGIVKMDLDVADKVAHGDAEAAAKYAADYCATFGLVK